MQPNNTSKGGRSINTVFLTVFLWCFLILVDAHGGHGGEDYCYTKHSRKIEGKSIYEAYCNCDNQGLLDDHPLYKLFLSNVHCQRRPLRINWKKLQNSIILKEFEVDNANVVYDHLQPVKSTRTSIIEVTFKNCRFVRLPRNAFEGLDVIETIRMIDSTINVIETGAFTGFERLAIIEFENCRIAKIMGNSFDSLPSIRKIAFVDCKIGLVRSFAITLIHCPFPHYKPITDNFDMDRSLVSLDDVSLGVLNGSVVVFYSTLISELYPYSIQSNILSYIIFAGNGIERMNYRAIQTTLNINCRIQAKLLVIRNTFNYIHSEIFRDVAVNTKTKLALTLNKFYFVAGQHIMISEYLYAKIVYKNEFRCDGGGLYWASSSRKNKLEKLFLSSSVCIGSERLVKEYVRDHPEDIMINNSCMMMTDPVTLLLLSVLLLNLMH